MQVCPQCSTNYDDADTVCPKDGSPLVTIRHSQAVKIDPYLGRTIKDTYLIQSRLGAGGMGAVYKAVQKLLGRVVAIKLLPQHLAETEEGVLRFHREAKSASSLCHPNTIIIYDYGQEPDGLLYLAMEYIDGKPLTALIREGNLTPRRMYRILEQIVGSLMEAHGHGMIHRDLKPDNIMITSRAGEEDFVKVLDFGLAKAVGKDAEGVTEVTTGNVVMGTPAYMSPEQIQNMPLTPASDQYSLGVIVFEMITGKAPFLGTTSLAVCMQHVNDLPPQMHEVYPGLPSQQGLEDVVHRCLAKTVEERYADVAEFLAALQPYFAGDDWRSGSAVFESPVREGRSGKSRPSVAMRPASGRQSQAVEPPLPPKKSVLVPVLIGLILLLVAAGVGYVLLGSRGGPPGGSPTEQASAGSVAAATDPAKRGEAARQQQFDQAMGEGRRLFQQEHFAKALEQFEQAHGLVMKNPEPYQWIGETHKRRGSRTLARLAFEKYLQLKEGDLAPSVLESKLAELLGPEPASEDPATVAKKPADQKGQGGAEKPGPAKKPGPVSPGGKPGMSPTIDTNFE